VKQAEEGGKRWVGRGATTMGHVKKQRETDLGERPVVKRKRTLKKKARPMSKERIIGRKKE